MASAGVVVNFNKLPQLIANNPKLADAAVDALARDGERYVKQIMEESPADGATYIVGTGQVHVASSPGNPPRIDTGTLVNSIYVGIAGYLKRRISGQTDYLMLLEFGTSKMAARPSFLPMAVYLQQNADVFFDNLIEV